MAQPENPLIVQSDKSVLLETDNPLYEGARDGKYELPENVRVDILDYVGRYGRIRMEKRENTIVLTSADDILITEIANHKEIRPHLGERWDRQTVAVLDGHRGLVKQALIKVGFPVEDLAGYVVGDPFEQRLR